MTRLRVERDPMTSQIGAGRVKVDGDVGKLVELVGYLDAPDPDFAILTP
ncbi:alkyl sulfatase C-terminal domain-containing protein [Nocardia cyriacigeorgica]|nr:alkyl sulfatase C-terminal domain-containing protein [Nocardia cyriacigeorgica]